MEKLTISDQKYKDLKYLYKKYNFNSKRYLIEHDLNGSYNAFSKFLKEEDYQIPLEGLNQIIKKYGVKLNIVLQPVNQNTTHEDLLWEKLFKDMELNLKQYEFKKKTEIKKKRNSTDDIKQSLLDSIKLNTISIDDIDSLF